MWIPQLVNHSSIDGPLSGTHLLAIVINAAMDVGLQKSARCFLNARLKKTHTNDSHCPGN